jgi:glycerophosphoryl diester phosphodiesterase
MSWKSKVAPWFDGLYNFTCRGYLYDSEWEGVLIGHRGVKDHPTLLENTLEAFDVAASRGAGLELDVRMTGDGNVVVSHDPDLLRVFGVKATIEENALIDLKHMEARLSSLREVINCFKSRVPMFMIEIKREMTSDFTLGLLLETQKIIHELGVSHQVILLGLDAELCQMFKKYAPELKRAFVTELNLSVAIQYLPTDVECGHFGWYFNYPEELIEGLNSQGLPCGVGFMNEPEMFYKWQQKEVKFLFSDRVDKLFPEFISEEDLEGSAC